MKSVFVFVLFVLIVAVNANEEDELKEKVDRAKKECAEKTNFSEENFKKLHDEELVVLENAACFQKCFFETFGIIRDGAIDKEKVLAITKLFKKDLAKAEANLQSCGQLYKPDYFDCDAAWEIYKCFH